METQLVRAAVGDGVVVQVEVPGGPSGEEDVGIGRLPSFDAVSDTVGAIAGSMTRAIAAARPDEAEIEFGVDIGVEAGQLTSLIVKGTTNATLTVRLKWTRSPAPP